jgi:adenosylcobyric acid synthase
VNKMRGDPRLFESGMAFIAQHTGWRALGLVPHFEEARRLPAEDAADLADRAHAGNGPLVIAVPVLPHIANFDDLDPLAAEPGVSLRLIPRGKPLPAEAAAVILPGSKATLADLAVLRDEGWDIDVQAHRRRGGWVLGLCGGYQMLGQRIADPLGIEGPPGAAPGLGLLGVETVLTGSKRLVAVSGTSASDGVAFDGYEMHVGETTGPDTARPVLRLGDGRHDGASSRDGRVLGTYAHGLFAHDAQRAAWLRRLGDAGVEPGPGYEAGVEGALDALARHLEAHIEIPALFGLARSGAIRPR